MDIQLQRKLISQGWIPPVPDSPTWRQALSAFYNAKGLDLTAARVLDAEYKFDEVDRSTVRALAAAAPFLPAAQ